MNDISTHISKFENLRKKLSLARVPITEDMVTTKNLITFLKEHQHFYSAWDSKGLKRI